MGALPIVDLQTFRRWSPAQTTDDDDVLQDAIEAASELLESQTRRHFAAPVNAEVEIHDGSGPRVRGRDREILQLTYAPVLSVTSIKENGVALTFASGYSTTADVVLVPARGQLVRRASTPAGLAVVSTTARGWGKGVQNLEATYKAGYNPIPTDIVTVAIELGWMLYRESRRSGRQNVSRGGQSLTFLRELSPISQAIVRKYERMGPWA